MKFISGLLIGLFIGALLMLMGLNALSWLIFEGFLLN